MNKTDEHIYHAERDFREIARTAETILIAFASNPELTYSLKDINDRQAPQIQAAFNLAQMFHTYRRELYSYYMEGVRAGSDAIEEPTEQEKTEILGDLEEFLAGATDGN